MFLHQALPTDIQSHRKPAYEIKRKASPKGKQSIEGKQINNTSWLSRQSPSSTERNRDQSLKSTQKPNIGSVSRDKLFSNKQANTIKAKNQELRVAFGGLKSLQNRLNSRGEQSKERQVTPQKRFTLCKIENKATRSVDFTLHYKDLSNIDLSYLLCYEGQTQGDLIRHGFGTQWFTNGEKFVGEYKDNKASGHGTFYGRKKTVIGAWLNGHLQQIYVEVDSVY